jgi:hypothetical protein
MVETPPVYRLAVGRREFAESLKLLSVARPKGRGADADCIFEHFGGMLTVSAPGAATELIAAGSWPRMVRASLRALLDLRTRLPPGDPLTLRFQGGRLWIEKFSIPAKLGAPLVGAADAQMDLPLNPRTIDYVRLKRRRGREELLRLGLWSAVEEAEKDLEARVRSAAKILAPLGIAESRLRAFVELLLGTSKK